MEKLDKNTSKWIMEFLLQNPVPDIVIEKALTLLPLSGADRRLKKSNLLRILQSELNKASLSEKALQILENLEELYRHDDIPVSDAMRRAYCAIAVECTVKYLIVSPEDPSGEYYSAVRRIWRGRFVQMSAEGNRDGLISDEFLLWRDDVEAALLDTSVSERLVGLNTRLTAMNEVKQYLKEAWEIMGPSFLDSVYVTPKSKRLRTEGVCEFALCGGGLERNSASGDKNDDDHDGACRMDDVVAMGENQGNEQLEEKVDSSADLVATTSEAKRLRPDGVCEFVLTGEPLMIYDGGLERNSAGCDKNGDEDKGACRMDDVTAMGENQGKEQLEEKVDSSVDSSQKARECDSAKGDKATQKGIHLKRKHSALRTCHRGVKIAGGMEEEPEKLGSKSDPLPSAEVNKVRESLKSSSMELKALVMDPLPDALHTSEVVRSKLAAKDKPIENQSGDVDVPNSDVCMHIVLYQPDDANLAKKSSANCSNAHLPNITKRIALYPPDNANHGKKSFIDCSNAHLPNIMERKSSATTNEWNDSIDNSPQGKHPRRRIRRWTSLEEDTLRAGVKTFGEGNWTTIRNFYSNIFEFRSAVDLKDKWRNMMR